MKLRLSVGEKIAIRVKYLRCYGRGCKYFLQRYQHSLMKQNSSMNILTNQKDSILPNIF